MLTYNSIFKNMNSKERLPFKEPAIITKSTTDRFTRVNILFTVEDSLAPKARAAKKKCGIVSLIIICYFKFLLYIIILAIIIYIFYIYIIIIYIYLSNCVTN